MSKELSSIVMERKAVNPSGRIGSLYDGYRDRVLESSFMTVKGQQLKSSDAVQYEFISSKIKASYKLLQSIGVQDELRLSLLLNLTRRSGIAEVMNYSCEINDRTRFLYYSWISRREQLAKEEVQGYVLTEIWNANIDATHMITGVTFGIDVVFVLQPSETEIIKEIDQMLEKIRGVLKSDNHTSLKLSANENVLFNETRNLTVYSNIPTMKGITKLSDFLEYIHVIKRDCGYCHPLTYTLKSIAALVPSQERTAFKMKCPLQMKKAADFSLLPSELKEKVERHMVPFRDSMKYLETFLYENRSNLLGRDLQHRLQDLRTRWSLMKDTYTNELKKFSKLVVDTRRDHMNAIKIQQALHDDNQIALKKNIDEVIQNLNELKAERSLNTHLKLQPSTYPNVAEPKLDQSGNIKTTERMPTNDDRRNRVNYSSDASNKQKPQQLPKPCNNSSHELVNTFDLQRTSYHVSNYTSKLPDTEILPPRKTSDDKVRNLSHSLSSAHPDVPVASSSSTDEIINILLLGETGVGKSTFINAFANYLIFDSLGEGQSNEPMVLIPVSFIMTTGNNFEEKTIKFGEFDSSNNEDFDHPGQSVTQHCKSYIFDLHHTDGKKLRIIDTPGFGDTRGLDQDERNMENTLQYVNKLTHLNAVCFLLKPNASRLSISFRTYLTQLLSLLGSNARQNIIFCFTNARSTFYGPGNTAHLLKTLLESLSIGKIPFKKDNTFCFDNESFRFLVALQNNILFTNDEKHEYETSWSTSVKESKRLINYIRKELNVYDFEGGWQSIKHAQFEISYMIRPILETMRNILRNIILWKRNLSNEFIELSPKPVHYTATRCLVSKPKPQQVGKFWIIPTVSYELQDDCLRCSCTVDQHVPMNYILEYQCLYNVSTRHQDGTADMLDILCNASAEFAHFLMRTAYSTKKDPFLIGFAEMIDEENRICKSQQPNDLNLELAEALTILQNQHALYYKRMSDMKSNQGDIDLPAIYRSIKSIGEYPMVREQMIAVRQTQQIMMEQYEYEAQKI